VEIWNLVFTQFDRQSDGSLPPLPQKNIDTGMGLERMAACMQDAPTNMDIDIFQPILGAIQEASGRPYGERREDDVLMRRIADHARAVTFCIADGVLPANSHRGYVLKRLLRRAVLDGRTLGIGQAFLGDLVPVVSRVMGLQYTEVTDRAASIAETVRTEEEKFLATLARGLTLIDTAVETARTEGRGQVDGRTAFELYDTYGFPYELAEEVVGREGLSLDEEGFRDALEEARERARQGAAMKGDIFAGGPLAEIKTRTGETQFVGYDALEADAAVVAVVRGEEVADRAGAGDAVEIVLDQTAFYAESGGQIGDTGAIVGAENLVVRVLDVQRIDGIFVHIGEVESGVIRAGDAVRTEVDADRRARITRNHTATHLLHWGLRQVLGESADQKGSWVGPERMRFDFQASEALSPEQLEQVEDLANLRILENAEVRKEVLSIEEARARGAIALFGEKYSDIVRMVSCGAFSRELCGGCHVGRTGDIGQIRILAETSVAAGIRRIEATTGLDALRAARHEAHLLREAAALLKAPPAEVPARIRSLNDELRERARELTKARQQDLGGRIREAADAADEVDGVRYIAVDCGEVGAKELRGAGDLARKALKSGVALLGARDGEKAALVCVASDDAQEAGLKAGDVIRQAATRVDGKGGGRPDMAQAGGKAPQKLGEALDALPEILRELRSQ
jgi:alanyl-tRNA synthetase